MELPFKPPGPKPFSAELAKPPVPDKEK